MLRQTAEHERRRSRWAGRLIGTLAAAFLLAVSASAQTDAVLPPLGGQGGTQFVARCPQGQHLAGFELLVSNDVDAIRPLCVAAYGPADAGPVEPYPTSFGESERDPVAARLAGQLEKKQLVCPRDAPVVTGMYVRWEGRHTLTVNNIHLFCGVVAATQTPAQYPAAVYDGPRATPSEGPFGLGGTGVTADSSRQSCPAGLVAVGINGRSGDWVHSVGLICGAPRVTKTVKPARRVKVGPAPVHAGGRVNNGPGDGALSGLKNASLSEVRCRGYSHVGGSEYVFFKIGSRPGSAGETIVVYEMAFTPNTVPAGENSEGLRPGMCAWINRTISDDGPLRIRFETVANAQLRQKLQGVPLDTSPTAAESYPDVNSIPRYLKVESHYWSFGGVADSGRGYFQAAANGHWKPKGIKPAGRVIPGGAGTPPGPPLPICEAALQARARNSPAAPGLEARCRAQQEANARAPIDVEDLAAKGEGIANQDPLAVELREQQPDDAARRGFDIGMAAAEGQTGPGPGKDRIRDSLPAEERVGFFAAVAFSLERNKQAERAALGATIAAADPEVAAARAAEADPFYRLGFDIATAIFGDKARGAQGNTQVGPGAQGIRNSLSPAAQKGFDAAVQFHLGRRY